MRSAGCHNSFQNVSNSDHSLSGCWAMLSPSPPGHRHSRVTESIVLPPDPEGSISSKMNEWLSSAGLEAPNKVKCAFYKSEEMSDDRCMERSSAMPELP